MYGQMAGPSRGLPHQSRKDRRRNRNYTPEQLAHRREQNRKSQRAFRDRKEQRIKELEQQISEVDQETEDINSALEALQAEYQSLLESKEYENGKGKEPEKST
ncbi:hypothetical protein B0T24DRAFT_641842 [Lasiosphaeria ovina]|uniref:Putative transcription factor kapC n=1 Tax=Lasiosphaeria ovina TaxID=92902 RepID=A0AAE0JTI6_9PEZI|nr:hypothetical protein B0T24DRAFT_641842 [Lasiosphaeria ovina]